MDGDSLPQDFEQGQLRSNITTQTNACKPWNSEPEPTELHWDNKKKGENIF